MKRTLLLLLLATILLPARPDHASAARLAVPAYFWSSAYWNQVSAGAPTVGMAIVNPDSGPGRALDLTWLSKIEAAQKKGIFVLGYVSTRYGTQSEATLRTLINSYYSWYKIDGIFFDEVATDCRYAPYYSSLSAYAKARGGKGLTVLNPGGNTNECFVNAADLLVNYEGSYANYLNWSPSSWVYKYSPHHFWHIVHSSSLGNMPNAVRMMQQRNARWMYVTDDTMGNPYDTIPNSTYWSQEQQAVSAATAPAQPISGWYGWNDGTNAYYKFDFRPSFSGTWNYYQAYLDTDQNTRTGQSIGGIGADYKLENGYLYVWRGSWYLLKSIKRTSGSSWVQWSLLRGDIGLAGFPAQLKAVFSLVSTSGASATSPTYTHSFSASTGSIVAYSGSNDANNVYYSATFTRPFNVLHVGIDTDNNPNTGYRFGPIGMEYLIENDKVFRWIPSTRTWTAIGVPAHTVSGSVHTWTVSRFALGMTAPLPYANTLVFDGMSGSPQYTTPAYRMTFSH